MHAEMSELSTHKVLFKELAQSFPPWFLRPWNLFEDLKVYRTHTKITSFHHTS